MPTGFTRIVANVPPPDGSRSGTTAGYARFIPREELGAVAAWQLGELGSGAAAPVRPGGPLRPAAPVPEASGEGPSPEQWLERIAQAREDGRQAGFAEGLAELDALQTQFVSQVTGQIGQLVQSFDAQFDAVHAQMAAAIARSAVRLAERVLRGELHARPDHVVRLAEEAVETVQLSARHLVVHVHPTDLPLVASGAQETLRARGARLVADASIARGGCLIESDLGTVDATIEARWAHASASLGHPAAWSAQGPVPETRGHASTPAPAQPAAGAAAQPSAAAHTAKAAIVQASTGASAAATAPAPPVDRSAAP